LTVCSSRRISASGWGLARLARYADTSGYHFDGSVMWIWRDWVINAFNKNKPFDQFTVEQLAGDHAERHPRSKSCQRFPSQCHDHGRRRR
jgi:hypothetical protein